MDTEVPMSKKLRLDVLLVERGLQESRQKAQATIMSGLVFVGRGPGRRPALRQPGRAEAGEGYGDLAH